MTLNRKIGGLSVLSQFWAVAHISKVNCAEMVKDKPEQHAYKILSIKRTRYIFHHLGFDLLDSRSLPKLTEASNLGTPSGGIIILLHAVHNCSGGKTDAVARHVSFSQITCLGSH